MARRAGRAKRCLAVGLCLLGVLCGTAAVAQMPPPGDALQIEHEFKGYIPEVVFFEGALPPPPSAFKKKIAEQKGLTLEDPKRQMVLGRLYRPDGEGPFPAVVLLTGTYGIWDWDDLWANRLRDWGYVVLDVDSMSPRGLYYHNTGVGSTETGEDRRYVGAFTRSLDALGTLEFLQAQPYVAPDRIAALGMSQGGSAAMYALSPRHHPNSQARFAAAIALYPPCDGFETFNAPLLVLIGDADEWVAVTLCDQHLAATQSDHELTYKVYPGAHHAFDFPGLDRRFQGRVLRHDPQAEADAVKRIRAFLERYLG